MSATPLEAIADAKKNLALFFLCRTSAYRRIVSNGTESSSSRYCEVMNSATAVYANAHLKWTADNWRPGDRRWSLQVLKRRRTMEQCHHLEWIKVSRRMDAWMSEKPRRVWEL